MVGEPPGSLNQARKPGSAQRCAVIVLWPSSWGTRTRQVDDRGLQAARTSAPAVLVRGGASRLGGVLGVTGFHLSLGLGWEGKKKGFSVRRLGDSRAHPEDGSPRWPPHRALGCQPRASLLLMWLLIGDRKPQGLRPVVERFAPVRIFLPLYVVFSRSAAPCVQFADLQGKKKRFKNPG